MASDAPTSTLPSLAGAAWLEQAETQAVFAALSAGNHRARAVGGAVRNALLGVPVRDIDFATTSSPDETARLAERAGLKAIPTGADHGTVTIVANHTPFEVTTLRRDVETDGRRARVAFTDDWAADAQRRDFTINALYCDETGALFDPLGGYPDLAARRVRFIGDASERIREDHLRILRFLRFTSEYGHGAPDADSLQACRDARGSLVQLSRERVRAELLRLMVTPRVAELLPAFADDFIAPLLPEAPDVPLFLRLVEIEQAQQREGDAVRRLGALSGALPGRAGALKDALRLSAKEFERLARLSLKDAALDVQAPATEAKGFIYRHGTTAFTDGALLTWARSPAPAIDATWAERLYLAEHWQPPALPVRGSDITALGVSTGPRVGHILAAFEDWWIGADFPDDAELLARKLTELVRRPEG